MIKVFPFRGIRYNRDKVGDLSNVVTVPYDNINDELMEKYYKAHPNNFTRISRARVEPDTLNDNRYLRARNYMDAWLKGGILVRDSSPAIYPYFQEYTIDGVTRKRKGVTLLVNLREGEIKAHEKTLDGPKADRLNLMWATGCHPGHIFILYPDQEGRVNAILDKTASSTDPIAEAFDNVNKANHKLWSITDTNDIKAVQDLLAPHDLFIADGHHRTETARNYMKAMDLIGLTAEGTELPENCLMTLISMDDPGLIVLPTHRFVHSLDGFDKADFLRKASTNFTVENLKSSDENLVKNRLAEVGGSKGQHAIAVFFKDNTCSILKLKDEAVMKELLPGDRSDAWRNLDVNVLHVALLENLLGIDSEKLAAQTNVKYYRHIEEARGKLTENPNGNAVFVMNATRVSEVREVAQAGERMPQKSTDFFPKLLSGFVFNKIRFTGWPGGLDEYFRK